MPNPILLTPETLHTLVLDYLVKNCHTRTAKSFLNALATTPSAHLLPHSTTLASKYAPLLQTADQRHRILQLLLEGAVLDALKLIQNSKFNHKFASAFPMLNFRLHCQHFIELLRAGNVHEALRFAQDDLAALARQSQHMMHVLQEIAGALAYEDIEQSPYAAMFDTKVRGLLSGYLNNALVQLSLNENKVWREGESEDADLCVAGMQVTRQATVCLIEKVLRQMYVVDCELRGIDRKKEVGEGLIKAELEGLFFDMDE